MPTFEVFCFEYDYLLERSEPSIKMVYAANHTAAYDKVSQMLYVDEIDTVIEVPEYDDEDYFGPAEPTPADFDCEDWDEYHERYTNVY